MSQTVHINDTLTFTPTSYTGATNFASENTTYAWSRGYNGSEYTRNYARFQLNASSTTTDCYIYYVFSVSGIPSNATITSVTCSARISKNNRVGTSNIQLYSGTTAKGTAVTLTSTSETTTTISSPGTWTTAQLKDDPRVGLTLSYSGAIITGITWSVTYTANEPAYYKYTLSNVQTDHNIVLVVAQDIGTFYIKQNGTWNEVSKIYLKQNGSWVEQDLDYLDNNNIKYIKQG